MAVFNVEIDGNQVVVACPRDGHTNLFKHADRLVTCNKCGFTFETPAKVKLAIEQVVTKYEDN